jgi:peptidoglycan/xylan/chitin deacetylase (PgdA/CDA1 family)
MSVAPLVLAYHGVGRFTRFKDPHNLMIEPEIFYEQIQHLRNRGLEFVTMTELGRRMHEGEPLGKVAAITFDDGSVDNLIVLPEVLEALRVPATVYACPGLFGERHPFLHPDSGSRLMTAEELKELSTIPGFEIGSHTSRHADLSSATQEQAYDELACSKWELEDLLERPVLSFAYPKGSYSAACPEAAERAGYLSAVTCGRGATTLPYELPRVCVSALDGRLTFSLKTRGLYDGLWTSPLGRVARRITRPFRHRRYETTLYT